MRPNAAIRTRLTRLAPVRRRWLLGMALLAGVLVAAVAAARPEFPRWLANLNYDLLVRHGARATVYDSRLELVVVDDATIEQEKRYPLRRDTHARLCAALKASGARAVVWDFLMNLPEEHDEELAAAMAAVPTYLAAAAEPMRLGRAADAGLSLVEEGFLSRCAVGERVGSVWAAQNPHRLGVLPLPTFAARAAGGGQVNKRADGDGLLRRTQLVTPVGDRWLPSLALAAALQLLGLERADVRVEAGREMVLGEAKLDRPIRIAVDAQGFSLGPVIRQTVDPLGARGYASVLAMHRDFPGDLAEALRGKTVVVGTACTGSGDYVATPADREVPGCVVVFCTLNAILKGGFIREVPVAWGWVLTLALPLSLGLVALRQLPWLSLAASGALVVGLVGATWVLFQRQVFLPVGLPLIATLLASAALLGVNHFHDWRYSARLAEALARFVSPALLQEVQRNPRARPGSEARRTESSVLFLDLAGFTRFCEEQEPESISEFLGRFYRMAIECVVEHGGTVDKVMGDGVLAYFATSELATGKEQMAVQVALAALERFGALGSDLARRGFPELQVRCAITTGYVTLGVFGDARHATYTVVGRPVNLASRLQALATPGTVVVDRPTAMRVEERFKLEPLDTGGLKGIDRKVEVWRVVARLGA